MSNIRQQQLRGYNAALTSKNPVLLDGELIYNKDTKELKIGDGVSTYTELPSIIGGGGIGDLPPNDDKIYAMKNGMWTDLNFTITGNSYEGGGVSSSTLQPYYQFEAHPLGLSAVNASYFSNLNTSLIQFQYFESANNIEDTNYSIITLRERLNSAGSKTIRRMYISNNYLNYNKFYESDYADTIPFIYNGILYLLNNTTYTEAYSTHIQGELISFRLDDNNNINTNASKKTILDNISCARQTEYSTSLFLVHSDTYMVLGFGNTLHIYEFTDDFTNSCVSLYNTITLSGYLTGLIYAKHLKAFIATTTTKYVYKVNEEPFSIENYLCDQLLNYDTKSYPSCNQKFSRHEKLFYLEKLQLILYVPQNMLVEAGGKNVMIFSNDGYSWINSMSYIGELMHTQYIKLTAGSLRPTMQVNNYLSNYIIHQILYAKSINLYFIRCSYAGCLSAESIPSIVGYFTRDFKYFGELKYNKNTLWHDIAYDCVANDNKHPYAWTNDYSSSLSPYSVIAPKFLWDDAKRQLILPNNYINSSNTSRSTFGMIQF